jgi:NAD(P)-dependent dehydrogenase (short-subunit alcohol dehydrogenase family)
MQEMRGKVAVVTGGGSGIGRGLALTFAAEGMNVAIADVEVTAAEAVAEEVRAKGVLAMAAKVDVSDRAQLAAFADRVYSELGSCDLLCNNAGVLTFKRAQETTDADWDWTLGVNLFGVINGVQAFLPRMLDSGHGGHIVNTASIAGLFAGATPGLAAYTTSKFAVVGYTESLRADLADTGIGVSVLCPGGVATQIGAAGRNRPDRFGGPEAPAPRIATATQQGMDPMRVGEIVLRGVKEDRLYIFTHPETRPAVDARAAALAEGFDWSAKL